ncbi:MAG: alkaline phosphatase family protein [Isosphaeraceae bacterium]
MRGMVQLAGALMMGFVLTVPARAGQIGDVFYIALENHNFTQPSSQTSPQQLLGNPAAPFLNSLITPGNPNAAQSSYASAYTNIPGNHPSEPNYVWHEAGLAGPLNDADPFPNNIVNAPNLSGLLQKAGIPWKSYQEDIDLAKNSQGNLTNNVLPQSQWTVPLTSFSGTSSAYTNPYNGSNQYNFAAKHDGQLFFTATNGGNNPTPSNPEAKYYAPLQQLQTDLANNTVDRYNWITPNQYNDMHSTLAGGFTYHGVHYTGDAASIAQGDNFLSLVVPQIMASQAYKNNGLIVIWNDETEGEVGNDPSRTSTLIALSPLAKGNAFDSTMDYTHSSDLKSMQELFGVYGPNGFLGDAGTPGVNDFSDLFQPGALGSVPEPASIVLTAIAMACVGGWRLWKRRSAAC